MKIIMKNKKLKLIIDQILNDLSDAVSKKYSPFKNLVLSTVSKDRRPNSRIVILRSFSKNFLLSFYSDLRSSKVKEIKNNPDISLLCYDEKRKIQLRILGKAKIAKFKEELWKNLNSWSKKNYTSIIKPGSKISEKKMIAEESSKLFSNSGKNFGLVEVKICQIEWLKLSRDLNERAMFKIKRKSDKILIEKHWLIP